MAGLPLSPGTELGNYIVDRVLGAGGFGITYLAFSIETGETVAIKEFFPRSAAVRDDEGQVWINDQKNESVFNRGLERFWEEAETLARFSHPHIVKVIRRFLANGTAYIVLEYIQGASVEQWAQESLRRPSQLQLDAFMSALIDALETIHRNQFLHRDIAPKNILLSPEGLPVLIDFGSARLVDSSRNMTAMVTPNYAPYEQHLTSSQGQGPWTDIYGAAATMHRILMGKPPMDAVSRAMDDTQYVALANQFRDEYRRPFLEALDWGLKVHARDRPQSVTAWRRGLLEGYAVGGRRSAGLDTEVMIRKNAKPSPIITRLFRKLGGGNR